MHNTVFWSTQAAQSFKLGQPSVSSNDQYFCNYNVCGDETVVRQMSWRRNRLCLPKAIWSRATNSVPGPLECMGTLGLVHNMATMPLLICRLQILVRLELGQSIPNVVHTVPELQLWTKGIEVITVLWAAIVSHCLFRKFNRIVRSKIWPNFLWCLETCLIWKRK